MPFPRTPVDLPDYLTDPALPPVWVELTGSWWFTAAPDAAVILSDPRFASPHERPDVSEDGWRGADPCAASLAAATGKRHDDLRRMISGAFSDTVVDIMRPSLINLSHGIAAALPQHAEREQSGLVDLAANYARPLPTWVMLAVIGVDPQTAGRLYPRWWRWIEDAATAESPPDRDDRIATDAWSTWQQVLNLRRAELRRGAPWRAGVLDALLNACDDHYPAGWAREVSEEDVIGTLHYLATDGVAPVAAALMSCVDRLASTGRWAEAAEIEALRPRGTDGVARALAYEAMRASPPFATIDRVAREDVTVGGCPVRAGQRVTVNVAAAQSDERAMPDGGGVTAAWGSLLTWGRGPHRCLGERFAIDQITEGLRVLLLRYPKMEPRERGETVWQRGPSIPALWVRLGESAPGEPAGP